MGSNITGFLMIISPYHCDYDGTIIIDYRSLDRTMAICKVADVFESIPTLSTSLHSCNFKYNVLVAPHNYHDL